VVALVGLVQGDGEQGQWWEGIGAAAGVKAEQGGRVEALDGPADDPGGVVGGDQRVQREGLGAVGRERGLAEADGRALSA
jgi:hypothetical protein